MISAMIYKAIMIYFIIFQPEQICHYEVEYKGINADSGDEELGGLKAFSTTVSTNVEH